MRRSVVRLARGIYQDRHGLRVKVERGGVVEDVRFPPHTPMDVLITARTDIETRLAFGPIHRRAGTLAADVTTCLATIASPRARQTAETLLGHWLRAPVTVDGDATTFGALPRTAITSLMVKTQLAIFAALPGRAGPRFRPKTVKELRRLLGWIYTTLDGADARNPVRGVKGPRVRYDDPRGIDYGIIERILTALPDRGRPEKGKDRPGVSLTKARLRVMAYTGLHQSELAKLTPRDVDLAGGRVWIAARVKGAGADGAWHTLTDRGQDALEAFVAAGAWGRFSTRSMAKTWRVGLARAKATWDADPMCTGQPWPVRPDARPYDLRHSFGTAIYLADGDIRAAQEMLRHRQGSTTDRYTRAGVTARVTAATSAFNRALPRATPTEGGPVVTKAPPVSRRPAVSGAAPRGRILRDSAEKAQK